MLYTNKDLRKLIIPLVFEQLLAILVGMVDTVMIASVGLNRAWDDVMAAELALDEGTQSQPLLDQIINSKPSRARETEYYLKFHRIEELLADRPEDDFSLLYDAVELIDTFIKLEEVDN